MSATKFTLDELAILAIYEAETPESSIKKIEEALPYVDDSDMSALMLTAKEKLEKITIDEYKQLNLKLYLFKGDEDFDN